MKMKNVLYVDCCIRREESRTRVLAEHFLEKIQKRGDCQVERLCLMDEPLTFFSEGFFRQREELIEKKDFSHPRFRYAHQFAAADKIVIAAPFWDLSIPALLKVYIENLCVDGITFRAGAEGLSGLCRADHMAFLTTRGAVYENSPMETGSLYMKNMSEFFGIDRYTCIAAEGLDMGIRPVEAILAEAMAEASSAAEKF